MKRKEAFNIPSIHESIRADYDSGKITLYEAALEWYKAGWTPYISHDYARKKLNVKQP